MRPPPDRRQPRSFDDDAQLVGGVAQEHEVVGALDLVEVVAHVLDGQRRVGLEVPLALTDEHAGDATATHGVGVARHRAVLVGQPRDQRRHQTGRELVGELVAEDLAGHPGTRGRRDGVGLDVVALALLGEHVRETDEAHLGGAVVGLAEVAEESGRRGGDHDAPVRLLTHVHPRRLRHVERAAQMDVEHRVDEVGSHVVEALVAQDARVVHDDVDAPEGVERGLHDRRAALGGGDRVRVEHGLAAGGLDLVDDLLAGSGVTAGTVDRAADVVDDHERTPAGEEHRVLAPEAAARTGDDRHLAVETEIRHRHSTPESVADRRHRSGVAPRSSRPQTCNTPPHASGAGDRVTVASRWSTSSPSCPAHATDPVRVRVRSCGICGSDLHLAAWNLPVTLGHEFAGSSTTAPRWRCNRSCGAASATGASPARPSSAASGVQRACTACRSTAAWPTR